MSTDIQTGNMPVNLIHNPKNPRSESHSVGSTSLQDRQIRSVDTVSITDEVSRLQEIETLLAAIPAVNGKLVAKISQEIANGSFEVDPRSTASKLIEMESGVLNTDNS